MKPDKNYKMKKTTKRMLSLYKFNSKIQKNSFKRMMILAELAELDAQRRPISRKELASSGE